MPTVSSLDITGPTPDVMGVQCYQIEIHKNPESRPKKSQNAVVFLKKSRDFSELYDDVISFLYFIERVIIVYG